MTVHSQPCANLSTNGLRHLARAEFGHTPFSRQCEITGNSVSINLLPVSMPKTWTLPNHWTLHRRHEMADYLRLNGGIVGGNAPSMSRQFAHGWTLHCPCIPCYLWPLWHDRLTKPAGLEISRAAAILYGNS